ncbi:DMT family transporter [Oceanibium sediminis]|uniref:DMT family transporter n=1 Tax=Oceanibium sediminis TaxID=2026339 RepID=UPI000DD2F964|nr:DMT family transporter [Oceanibium sediminis]
MSIALPREDRLTFAVIILAGAFFSFTMIDTMAKWLAAAGVPVLQVAFIRYAGHFVTSLALFLPAEGPGVFRSNVPRLQIGRAVFLLGSTVLNFFALSYLPLTVTTAIFFASPMVVCLLSIPVLGETVGLRRFIAVAVGFCGVLVITQPWSASFHPAMFFSLGALCCASMYFVLTRAVAGRDNNPTSQVIASGLPTLLLSPFVVFTWVWPDGALEWGLTLAIGCFATLGHSLAVVAHRYAPASTLAPMVYVQILYVTIISWAVFRQPPDAPTIVGTAIIVGAGFYIWQRERALRKTAELPRAGA